MGRRTVRRPQGGRMPRPQGSNRRSRSLDDPRPSGVDHLGVEERRAGGHVGLPLAGSVFGRWTATGSHEQDPWGWYRSEVRCECGRVSRIPTTNLLRQISGECRSCAASRRWGHRRIVSDLRVRRSLISRHKNVLARCYNPRRRDYKDYGGRGIAVHESLHQRDDWLRYVCTLSGHDDLSLTVDRIDVNGDYAPGNLRFVPMSVQNANKRRRNGL